MRMKRNLKLNYDNIARGLFLFAIGCAKKILLADPMTTNAQSFFLNSVPDDPGLLLTWFSAIEIRSPITSTCRGMRIWRSAWG